MEQIFLQNLKINNVRHLHDINIPLSETERKHLILTGKNGSGKTSVLEILKTYCLALENNQIHIEAWENAIEVNQNAVDSLPLILDSQQAIMKQSWLDTIKSYQNAIRSYSYIELQINEFDKLFPAIQDKQFMFVYFPAKRGAKYTIAKGPEKLDIEKEGISLQKNFNQHFLQFLVNQKTESSFAHADNDTKVVKGLEKWFANFEGLLKEIYGQNVTLEFDRKDWNFYLQIDGYERFDLNHLSDGYSAIINIIAELLLRMEKHGHLSHEMQGLVMIDEIETHLHIELQRKILPFLTTFFPNIQFVVTTHSPFVLSSINNAVIFDLEKKERVEDMSGYSAESIIENYFDEDQYSDYVKKKVEEYEALSNNQDLNDQDQIRLNNLELYFKKFPLSLSPELSMRINTIRLKKIA
jgi:predicted ATP-binding protein involved in virulence